MLADADAEVLVEGAKDGDMHLSLFDPERRSA